MLVSWTRNPSLLVICGVCLSECFGKLAFGWEHKIGSLVYMCRNELENSHPVLTLEELSEGTRELGNLHTQPLALLLRNSMTEHRDTRAWNQGLRPCVSWSWNDQCICQTVSLVWLRKRRMFRSAFLRWYWWICTLVHAPRSWEERQQSQHLANREEAGLHPVAGSCLTMLPGRVN